MIKLPMQLSKFKKEFASDMDFELRPASSKGSTTYIGQFGGSFQTVSQPILITDIHYLSDESLIVTAFEMQQNYSKIVTYIDDDCIYKGTLTVAQFLSMFNMAIANDTLVNYTVELKCGNCLICRMELTPETRDNVVDKLMEWYDHKIVKLFIDSPEMGEDKIYLTIYLDDNYISSKTRNISRTREKIDKESI